MTQPTPMMAEVNVRTLRAAQARDAMDHPVVLSRNEVRSITLTIPLLTDRNSYLVARIPDAAVHELLAHVRTLPANERTNYIRDWVMRNQQVIIEQHVRSGGRERRFRYGVVPVQLPPRVTESTPRRVEPPQPPVGTAVPRREPAAPQPAQPARRVIQPGEGGQPAQAGPTVTVYPPPVVAPAGPQPAERPVAAPASRAREEERWWLGGQGTQSEPYRIRLLTRRAQGEGIEASAIELPFNIRGVGRFIVNVTLSQISASRYDSTYSEIVQLCRRGFLQTEEGRGARVQFTGLPSASESRATHYARLPPDMRRYAQTH